MSRIDQLKDEATALEAEARNAGRAIKHCAALEIVARKYGYENWRACIADLALSSFPNAGKGQAKCAADIVDLKPHQNEQWGFELSIPARWNEFPPVPANSPYEISRFASNEDGAHLIIVFRLPGDPMGKLSAVAGRVQSTLAKAGFGNFITGKSTFGKRSLVTLDFDRVQNGCLWSSREYFISHETLTYVVGCGTTKRSTMIDLYDRIAGTFEPLNKT
jgi:hypothetical protein